jgi:titin
VNLVATCVSASKIDLTWEEWSTNVTEFKIYREINDSSSWTLLATTGPTTFTYSDTTATGNQTTTGYCYYVQACNDAGCSPPTYSACMPFSPSSLTATVGSNGKLVLNWTDNSDNERGFELYRKTGNCSSSGSWEKVKSAGIDRKTISDKKDLISGTTYSYKIRAYCRSWGLPYVYGYSGWSDCVSVTVP